jgi:hypothetical protein
MSEFMGTVVLIGSIIGFCLAISPLLIWHHTRRTADKLDKISNQLKELMEWLPEAEESIRGSISGDASVAPPTIKNPLNPQ